MLLQPEGTPAGLMPEALDILVVAAAEPREEAVAGGSPPGELRLDLPPHNDLRAPKPTWALDATGGPSDA